MKTELGPTFRKQYKKAAPAIKTAFTERLALFLKNPHHDRLYNHALKGQWQGYRSINISGDWRAIYQQYEDGEEIIILFKAIGTHSELYK